MKLTKSLRATALAASLATVMGLALTPMPATAASIATGNTLFTVALQPVTLLYYYSQINLTLNSTAMLAVAASAPGLPPATASMAVESRVRLICE